MKSEVAFSLCEGLYKQLKFLKVTKGLIDEINCSWEGWCCCGCNIIIRVAPLIFSRKTKKILVKYLSLFFEFSFVIAEWLQNFLPFILEETRAIIADGLDKVDLFNKKIKHGQVRQKDSRLEDVKPFNINLQDKAHYPKNRGNPLLMSFRGGIPDRIEHGISMNVLLLKTKAVAGLPEIKLIGLAAENIDKTELSVKVIIDKDDYDDYMKFFKHGARWQAHYLGAVVSEERMYDACLTATPSACLFKIATGNISLPYALKSHSNIGMGTLNLAQQKAIQAFFDIGEPGALLLQGPPGTGKTTTLVHLLKQVAKEDNRILVSAHSNKGVQVLALRAIKDLSDVPMVLVGVESKLNEALRPIFLNRWHEVIEDYFSIHRNEMLLIINNEFSNLKMFRQQIITNIRNSIELAKRELTKFGLIVAKLPQSKSLVELLSDPLTNNEFEQLQQLIQKTDKNIYHDGSWKNLFHHLSNIRSKWGKINNRKLERYLLNKAKIIFATLITSGRKSMLEMDEVDYLLVDEAAQSVEAATLIPMRYKPKKVMLVGDTKQLPATVISKLLDDDSQIRYPKHYKWSMMWRLIEENKQPSLMLNVQYRMHPHICQWPSGQYYNNELVTSPEILPMQPLTQQGITSRPYAIYQINGKVIQNGDSRSVCNIEEAKYVFEIVKLARREHSGSIGVITPYNAQKRLISGKLKSEQKWLGTIIFYKHAAMQQHVLAKSACVRYQIMHKCDLELCLKFCTQLSFEPNFEFNFVLARFLDVGLSGHSDRQKAFSYYLAAAKAGSVKANYYLASMYVQGNGVDRNLEQAEFYCRKCIMFSHEAILQLACLLLECRSYIVEEKVIIAKESEATELLKIYYEEYIDVTSYPSDEIERALEKIIIAQFGKVVIQPPMVNTPVVEANYYLGKILEEGKGIGINASRALFHYRCSSSLTDSVYRMGYMHEFGVGNIERDVDVATKYYSAAAERGHELAAKRLTWTYAITSKFSDIPDSDDKENDNCSVM